MAIVLDAMGSDQYPDPEVHAAVQIARESGEEIILVGNTAVVEPKLKALNPGSLPIRLVHADEMIEMEEHAVEAVKRKPNNSMAVGMRLVKSGEASAFITAGNTGGAYFNAVANLRRMSGISRPALTTPIPTRTGTAIFIDNGANADCRPEFLLEFGLMGHVYANKVLGLSAPRIGLLSNGEEEGKGSQLVKDAYPLLASSGLNFIGNVEPKEVFAGAADVIVSDGFTGNVFIKTSEAVAKLITDILKEGIQASWLRKLGYLFVKPAFGPLKSKLDPAEIGAALLIGVNGLVFIGHGRSDARALCSAIRRAQRAAQSDLMSALHNAIQERAAASGA